MKEKPGRMLGEEGRGGEEASGGWCWSLRGKGLPPDLRRLWDWEGALHPWRRKKRGGGSPRGGSPSASWAPRPGAKGWALPGERQAGCGLGPQAGRSTPHGALITLRAPTGFLVHGDAYSCTLSCAAWGGSGRTATLLGWTCGERCIPCRWMSLGSQDTPLTVRPQRMVLGSTSESSGKGPRTREMEW